MEQRNGAVIELHLSSREVAEAIADFIVKSKCDFPAGGKVKQLSHADGGLSLFAMLFESEASDDK